MKDWAERAAERAAHEDNAHDANVERSNRDAQIKRVQGQRLFREVYDWIFEQTEKYNRMRRRTDLRITQESVVFEEVILVRRTGPKCSTLRITYSAITNIVEWVCGGGAYKGRFNLTVSDAGEAYFETSHHERITPQEMGEMMLDKFTEFNF